MSNELNNLVRYVRLKGYTKTVLLMLCDMADNKTYRAWPSIKKLAEYCGISERTVIRAIIKLEKLDVLKKRKKISLNGGYCSNTYTINKTVLKLLSLSKCHFDRGGTDRLTHKTSFSQSSYKGIENVIELPDNDERKERELIAEGFNGRKISKKIFEAICRENGWKY